MTDGKPALSRLEAALVVTQTDLLGLQQIADDDGAPPALRGQVALALAALLRACSVHERERGDVTSAEQQLKLAAAADAIAAQHGEN